MKTGGLFYLSLAFILFCCPALHRRHLPPAFQREVIDMNKTYLRGDMYYADLGRGIGSEQEGYRPVLIIQNDTGNKHSPTVIVAAISSKVDAKAKLPTHYLLKAENGLELPSLVLMGSSAPLIKDGWKRTSDIWRNSISAGSTALWQSAWD